MGLTVSPTESQVFTATANATALFMIIINAASMPSNGALAAGTGTGQWQDCIYIPGYGTGAPLSISVGVQ